MFEAYSVAVKLHLVDGVTSLLGALSGRMKTLNSDIGGVNKSLATMEQRLAAIKSQALVGGVLAGAGAFGLSMFKAPLDSARAYELAFTRFKTLNLGEEVNRQADQFARGAQVMGVSAKQLMTTMSESVGLFGSFDMAKQVAPMLARLNMANAAVFKGKIDDIDEGGTRSLLQFIDRRGGTHDLVSFKRNLDLAEKFVTGSGGFIQFRDLGQFSQQGGTAFRGLSDEGLLNMALLMQEQGGSRAGTSFMSLYQNLIAGRTPKKTMAMLQEFGLGHLEMQTHATVGGKALKSLVMKDIKDSALLQANPTEWTRTVFLPALAAHGITSESDILKATNDLVSSRTASNQASIMTTQLLQILRDAKLTKNAMGADEVVKAYANDPNSKFADLHARYTDAMTELGILILPKVIEGVQLLTSTLKHIIELAREFPMATKAIAGTALVLSGLAAAGGTLMLFRAGLSGLGLVLGSAASTGGLIGALSLAASTAGGLALALGGGAVVGSLIYSMIEGTKAADWLGEKIARIFAAMGSEEAAAALRANGATGYQTGGASASWGQTGGASGSWGADTVRPAAKEIHVHTHNHLDGRKVAEIVTKHQANDMGRPRTGAPRFDPTMAPASGASGTW